MKVICPQCKKEHNIDESKIPAAIDSRFLNRLPNLKSNRKRHQTDRAGLA